ncbi:thiolase family protein [Nocardia sp. NPDC052278]|uniref:thiolase family protein n=1 Tax=unclassified Nocardia TaxID=2637762 RepID=UPI0036B0BEAC
MSGSRPEQQAVVRGIGASQIGRRLGRSELDLTLEACQAAIADAGLTRDDIDGLATFPGGGFDTPGLAGPGALEVEAALAFRTNWTYGGPEGGQLGGFFSACLAVATGLARHVLVYRTVGEATAQGGAGRAGTVLSGGNAPVTGFRRWLAPFDAHSPANWIALYAQRHMHEFGTTREHLGTIAVNNRRNAGRNPEAVYRSPMSLDDYFSARMISTPFGMYDCDVPCDGSVAFIVSHVDTADDGPRPALGVESLGWAMRHRPLWDQWPDMTEMAAWDAAAHLWERSDLRPADIDQVQLYDGFSFLPLVWLEALGFCEKGQSGPSLDSGRRISLEGELPLNTGGGQLSAGRLHGCGLLYEACIQLWGLGGDRQAGNPRAVAVGVGGGPTAGATVLVRR